MLRKLILAGATLAAVSTPALSAEWYIVRSNAPAGSDESACIVVDRKAVSKLLGAAMNSLESRDREILHMHYKRGLPFRAIGAHLNISESRVSQLHHRILSKLRSHFEAVDAA